MFCANCGKQLSDDARFCGQCGAVQPRRAPSPPPAAPPQAPQGVIPPPPAFAPPQAQWAASAPPPAQRGNRRTKLILAIAGGLVVLGGIAFALIRFVLPGGGKADPASMSGFWDGACKVEGGASLNCTLLLSLDDSGSGQAFLIADGVNITGSGMAAALEKNGLTLTGPMTGESSELTLAFQGNKDGNTLIGTGSTNGVAFIASFTQTGQADLTEAFASYGQAGGGVIYAGPWYGGGSLVDTGDLEDALGDDAPAGGATSPALSYEGAALLEFLQGEWVSEPLDGGARVAMLFHDAIYAETLAHPVTDSATLADWGSGEHWYEEAWGWYGVRADGIKIVADNGGDEAGVLESWVSVRDNNTIWISYDEQASDGNWAEAEYLEFYRVAPGAPLDMGLYLEGAWVSSIPFDEEAEAYIGLDFLRDGACQLSVAYSIGGDPGSPYQTISDWELELHDTYDLAITPEGFTVTIDGVPEAYQVDVQSFAAARFILTGGDEDILYYRAMY